MLLRRQANKPRSKKQKESQPSPLHKIIPTTISTYSQFHPNPSKTNKPRSQPHTQPNHPQNPPNPFGKHKNYSRVKNKVNIAQNKQCYYR